MSVSVWRGRPERASTILSRSRPIIVLASAGAAAAEVLVLWCWGGAGQIVAVLGLSRPDAGLLAVRSFAAAALAAVHLGLLIVLGGHLYPRRPFDRALGLCLALAATAAAALSAACAAAAR